MNDDTSTRPGAATLTTFLREHAARSPDAPAFTFLVDGERDERTITFAALDREARALAAWLTREGMSRERVLLLFEPGLEFVTAFFGCLYAGVVAVPAYPPDPRRLERTLPRLQAVITSAAPALALTSSRLLPMAPMLAAFAPDLASLRWEASDAHCGEIDDGWTPPAHGADDLAFLQFTSGSTAIPKGVMITHANLVSNSRAMTEVCRFSAADTIVSWVPFYHDMGLVAGICLPAMNGNHSVLMSPLAFLERPARWLEALSRYRGRATGSPNFALDLCVDAIDAPAAAALDLRALDVLLVGAEPLRQETLERFCAHFAAAGLRPEAIFQGYGLAETVLALTSGTLDVRWVTGYFDRDALREGRVVERSAGDPRAQSLVSCGKPMPGSEVFVVDPEQRRVVEPGRVGELWARGPNVAIGYWRSDEATDETFHATLASDPETRFLRTGDLGFVHRGEVFVSGRRKDLIIVRGKNHYPQDLERTVEGAHPRVRANCVAAFAIEHEGSEAPAVAAEVDTRGLEGEARGAALDEVIARVNAAVARVHGVNLAQIALLPRRAVPKTSSGKIARHLAHKGLLDGTLSPEKLWRRSSGATEVTPSPSPERAPAIANAAPTSDMRSTLASLPASDRRARLERWVLEQLAAVGGPVTPEGVRADEALAVDSLTALAFISRVESGLGVKLPAMELLLEGVRPGPVAAALLEALSHSTDEPAPAAATRSALIELRPLRARRPLFFAAGMPGLALYLAPLARALGEDQPFFALQAPGLDGREAPLDRVEALAAHYLAQLQTVQPEGPYLLGGHSFGGLIAYEMAQQLEARGQRVDGLFLLDTATVREHDAGGGPTREGARLELLRTFARVMGPRASASLDALPTLDEPARARAFASSLASLGPGDSPEVCDAVLEVYRAGLSAMVSYRPQNFRGAAKVTLVRAAHGFPRDTLDPARQVRLEHDAHALGWERVCPGSLAVESVPGDHFSMVTEPHVRTTAEFLRREVARHEGEGEATIVIPLERLVTSPPRARTESTRSSPDVALDPFDRAYVDDPYPMLRNLRERAPVYRSPLGAWFVTGYHETVQGLRERRLSSDSRDVGNARDGRHFDLDSAGAKPSMLSAWARLDEQSAMGRLYNNVLALIEPPRHTRLRGLLAPVFHPSAIARWRAPVRQRVAALLDQVERNGEFDVVRDLALPLPLDVIAEIIGIPAEDTAMLRRWTLALTQAFDPLVAPDVFAEGQRVVPEFLAYIQQHVERRRGAPGDDLLGAMCRAELEGDRLTRDELVANCVFLFVAGFETTTNSIGSGLLALLRTPDQLAWLRANPAQMPAAVDELLRFDGPFRSVFRTVTEDVEIGGRTLPRGEPVLFMLGGANRDPGVFADPDRLDLQRSNAKTHLGFGHGRHYCIGAGLARIEMETAIEMVLARFATLREESVSWRKSLSLRGLDRFTVGFARRQSGWIPGRERGRP